MTRKSEKLKLRIKKFLDHFLRILFRFKFLSIVFLFSCLPAGTALLFFNLNHYGLPTDGA